MECSASLRSFSPCIPSFYRKQHRPLTQICAAISYDNFIHLALDETRRRTPLVPSPLQEKYNSMTSIDGDAQLLMSSFEASKIRLLRSLSIETQTMQVLDFAVFPEPEYDFPIFCANFFSSGNVNIVVLDLNPLFNVINEREYRDKYYKSLIPLGVKYAELLPWGGKLTSESLNFFSPIVIWTRFTSSSNNYEILYSAFVDYYKAWLELMDQAVAETNASQIKRNREAQHRYLTWRAEKDPGHGVLKRLIGETQAKDMLVNFLFNGIDNLGSKTFLDYFPEYCYEDGTINQNRSIIGKSYENRPWDRKGEFESEESEKMDEDSKFIEELRQDNEHLRSQIFHIEKALKKAIASQEDVKMFDNNELQKSKQLIDDLNKRLESSMRTIDAKNMELLNLQTALGQYYAEIEAKEHLEGYLARAREESARLSQLLKDADPQAEVSKAEKEEILSKLSQAEKIALDWKGRVNKLEEDNSKLRRAVEQSMTSLVGGILGGNSTGGSSNAAASDDQQQQHQSLSPKIIWSRTIICNRYPV